MKLPELKALLENCHDARIRNAAPAMLACAEALQAALGTLKLVCDGLHNGNVTAKPVLIVDPDACSLPMQCLDEIVIADLENAQAALRALEAVK